MTTKLVSLYQYGTSIIFQELVDGKITFRKQDYSEIINDVYPYSEEKTFLPIDPVTLSNYEVVNYMGKYSFEYSENFKGGYIEHFRDRDLMLDIFTIFTKIVHVQPFEEKTKEDEAINEIIQDFKFKDHNPESFFELVEEKCKKHEIDLLKELENINFVDPTAQQ